MPAVTEKPTATARVAEAFFRDFAAGTQRQRSRLAAKAPLNVLREAALTHPDPFTRRDVLFFLDHYDNDASMVTFAAALHDPVDFVRNMALHSLACDACKSEELCVADVVPGLLEVLAGDPHPDLRAKAIPQLLRLSDRDPRARAAVQRAATADSDPAVRRAATDALAGRLVMPRKRYEREQRRHAKAGAGRRAR